MYRHDIYFCFLHIATIHHRKWLSSKKFFRLYANHISRTMFIISGSFPHLMSFNSMENLFISVYFSTIIHANSKTTINFVNVHLLPLKKFPIHENNSTYQVLKRQTVKIEAEFIYVQCVMLCSSQHVNISVCFCLVFCSWLFSKAFYIYLSFYLFIYLSLSQPLFIYTPHILKCYLFH